MRPDLEGKLLAMKDIAVLCGVDAPVASNWKRRHPDTFPKPIAHVAGGKTPLYWHDDVREFVKQRFAPLTTFLIGDS